MSTARRLTPMPQPGIPLPARASRAEPTGLPEITTLSRFARGGRWRTEALRSYTRPILIWITRGQGRITIAGQTVGYGPHNAIYLPAGTMHGFSVSNVALGHMVWLPADAADDWPAEPAHLRLRDAYLQRELTGHIGTLERELTSDAPLSDDAARLHMRLTAIWFARVVEEHLSDKAETGTRATHLAQAFTALVEQDFRRPVGVTHFATSLGVTPTHLSRVCRAVSGRPALDILSDRRHFEACRLLKDSALPVSEIARQTGFSSPAYFSRAFKARTHMSPSEFRFRDLPQGA